MISSLVDDTPDLIIMPRWVYRDMIKEIEASPKFQSEYTYLSTSDPHVELACHRERIGIAVHNSLRKSPLSEAVIRSAARSNEIIGERIRRARAGLADI